MWAYNAESSKIFTSHLDLNSNRSYKNWSNLKIVQNIKQMLMLRNLDNFFPAFVAPTFSELLLLSEFLQQNFICPHWEKDQDSAIQTKAVHKVGR